MRSFHAPTKGAHPPPSARDSVPTDGDAVALLTQDHRDVKKLFAAYQTLADREAPAAERLGIATEICEALTLHATVEEEIFYPALRTASDDASAQLDEAQVEHASVRELVAQIKAMDPEDPLYNAKVKVLGEYVDHHATEEEREIFPEAQQCGMDVDALGAQISARKDDLQGIGLH